MEYFHKINIKFGEMLCKIGLHNYFHYQETRPVEGLPLRIRKIKVPIRECDRCGYREHHLMPRQNGNYYNWRPYPKEHQEVLRFKKVGRINE